MFALKHSLKHFQYTPEIYPSGHITILQRRFNVNETSWRCIDVEATLYKRHVPAVMLRNNEQQYPKNVKAYCSIYQ